MLITAIARIIRCCYNIRINEGKEQKDKQHKKHEYTSPNIKSHLKCKYLLGKAEI